MAKPNPKLAPITLMGPTLGPRHGKSQSRTARTLLLACHFLRKSVTESIFPTYHQLKESSQRESPMPPEGVRRSSRIPKEMDIFLVGSDTEGKVFSEKTKTVLLSMLPCGCGGSGKSRPKTQSRCSTHSARRLLRSRAGCGMRPRR